jgi:hypothetical protein
LVCDRLGGDVGDGLAHGLQEQAPEVGAGFVGQRPAGGHQPVRGALEKQDDERRLRGKPLSRRVLVKAGDAGEDRGQEQHDLALHGAYDRVDLGSAQGGRVDLGPKRIVGAAHHFEPALQRLHQRVERVGRGEDAFEIVPHVGDVAGDHRLDDGVLGWEVAVEVARAHAGGTGEVLHGGSIEALFGEGAFGALKDAGGPVIEIECGIWHIRRANERSFTDLGARRRCVNRAQDDNA